VLHDDDTYLDKTWQEIHDAGFAVLLRDGYVAPLCGVWVDTARYWVEFAIMSSANDDIIYDNYSTGTANGYPEYRAK